MPPACPIDTLKNGHEVVLCDSELSRRAHKELYRFSDEVYVIADTGFGVFDAVTQLAGSCAETGGPCPSKIHIVLGWENILRVSSWKAERPGAGDAFLVLKAAGVTDRELQPFKAADINDLFPWLYYGKRFDVLRKVCHAAKHRMEGRLNNRSVRVDSHLIAEDTRKIVASSL